MSILEILEKIEKRLEKIEEELACMKKDTENMSSHITFVDGVYKSVRKPVQSLLSSLFSVPQLPEK
jgi:hypothetical protein